MTHTSSSPQVIKLLSWQCQALRPKRVTIEVLRSQGLNQLVLTGLPDAWLRDSRDKLRALIGSLVPWNPMARILVHLLPADESKNGAHLELPIVIGCLAVLTHEPLPPSAQRFLAEHPLVGSLNLSGDLEHTELSRMLERADPEHTVGPSRFRTLTELWDFLLQGQVDRLPPLLHANGPAAPRPQPIAVEGRLWQRFWLLAAAVAEVPVLLIGPPGQGKSHLARWAASLVPNPSPERRFEIEQIWSLAGAWPTTLPPVVAPHSRVNIAELIGHSRRGISRPGLFSLAHGGTLILDEFAELNRDCRETLRTILDRRLVVRQAHQEQIEWPADFWLIATANPCPCGFTRGDVTADCTCPASVRTLYKSRFSGPLLDRFGLKLYIDEQQLRDPRQSDICDWFDIARLDDAGEALPNLVAELRPRVREHLVAARADIVASPIFVKVSERERQTVTRLLAALRVLTNRPSTELIVGVFLLKRFEDQLVRAQSNLNLRNLTSC
ncbi:MAG: ATP-binding protein [Bdellovibrionales bacterium]|nr:ATP-binding protein [Bdellovibrionales bacterium]